MSTEGVAHVRLRTVAVILSLYFLLEVLDAVTFATPILPLGFVLRNYVGLTGLQASVFLFAFVPLCGFVAILTVRGPKMNTGRAEAPPPEIEGPVLRRSDLPGLLDEKAKQYVEVFPLESAKFSVYAAVSKEEGAEGYRYNVVEPALTAQEQAQLKELKALLMEDLDVDLGSIGSPTKVEEFLEQRAARIAKTYALKIPELSMKKFQYYLSRDFVRMGKVQPLMLDPLIEDISCDGPKIPIYIWHRDYESIPTNVVFESDQELDSFVSKLAYVAGKHISMASPLVDASLPDGSRIHLSFGKEVTQRGSTFTVRKFRPDPLTMIDLIKYNTASSELAAYLWYLVEKRLSMLVAGGSAAGKSIPYGEKVMIYDAGRPKLVAIGGLYDRLSRSKPTRTESGLDVIDCDGLETPAFDSNLKIGKFKVKSVVRHRSGKSVYRILTRSGREVVTTGDHSVFTLEDGLVVPYPVAKLPLGSFIAVPHRLPDAESPTPTLNLLETLSVGGSGMYIENVADYLKGVVSRLGYDLTARILGVRSRDLRHNLEVGFAATRIDRFSELVKRFGEEPDLDRLRVRPKTNRRIALPARLSVGKPLMRFLGYWAAEGMYQTGVTVFQLDEDTRDDMNQASLGAFGIALSASLGRDRTRLDLNSTVVKELFLKLFGGGKGAGNKRIPEFVLGQTNELLAEFLRGYFTGDASAGRAIEAATKSSELAHQLQYALGRFGIVAFVKPKLVKGRTYYRVFVYGQKNLRTFEDEIGFLDRAKRESLAGLTRRETSPHTNVDTIPGLGELLKKGLSFSSGAERKNLWSNWHSYWSSHSEKGIGSSRLMSYLEATGATGAYKDKLLTLAYSEIFWDEIAEVQEIPYDGEFVYDLEVPGVQNFVGGAGGIFLHNTTVLNAISMFLVPGQKIISCEDTPELNLPHENWIQSVTRGVGSAGEITLFDLLKNSLRQRPDEIIVGEVRGEEAYTLFQAISSVTGDTPVLISEGGKSTLQPISGFVDRFYDGQYPDGAAVHVSGAQVLSFDNRGGVNFAPIQYVLRHKAHEIYNLRYVGGAVRATGSHSIFVLDDDCRIVEKRVDEVNVGDMMVSFCGSETPRKVPVLDVEAVLRRAGGHSVTTQRLRALCPSCGSKHTKKAGTPFSKQRFWCHECKRVFWEDQVPRFEDILQADNGQGQVSFTRSFALPRLLEMDEEFARVLGVYMADGCVKHKGNAARVVFSLGKSEKALFIGDLTRFFAKHGSSPTVDDRGTYVVLEFHHSALAELFEDLCGRKLTEKRVPSVMWTASPGLVHSFISGWEADARRTTKARWTVINSARAELVSSLSWLARLNGQTSFISERSGKYPATYISKPHGGRQSECIPARPLIRLKALLGSTAWLYTPKKTASRISKKRARMALQEIIANKHTSIGYEATQLVSRITALADGSLIAAPVLAVEKHAFDGFVYDLSVPGSEAFFGGDTPVALHNTGHGGMGTIHADSVEAVINRLTSEPMNLPKSLVGTTLDCIVMELKLRMGDRSVRRIVSVSEVLGHDPRTDSIILNESFRWDPLTDRSVFTGRSRLFDKITQRYGTRPDEIRADIEARRIFLEWLASKNIRSYRDVSAQIREFYANPYAVTSRAKTELEVRA